MGGVQWPEWEANKGVPSRGRGRELLLRKQRRITQGKGTSSLLSVTVTWLTVWRGRVHRARRKFDSVLVPRLCPMVKARPLVPSAHTCEGQPCPGPCVTALVDGRGGVRSQLLRRPGSSDALCSSDATPSTPQQGCIPDVRAWGSPPVDSLSPPERCLSCFSFVWGGSYF